MVPINYLAVLVAAIVAFVLGWLWFGPVFGKAWMASQGKNMDEMTTKMKSDSSFKSKMMKSYSIVALMSLVMAFVLAHSLIFAATYLNVSGWSAALQAGAWNWLGFVVPVSVGSVLWDGKSWKWWCITAGYYLVSLILMSLVLAYWM